MDRKYAIRLVLPILAVFLVAGAAHGAVDCITFDNTLPDSTAPADYLVILDQYNVPPFNVRFSLVNAPSLPGPRLAQVGPPQSAFSGTLATNEPCGIDSAVTQDMVHPKDQSTVGCFFLTDSDVSTDPAQTLRIDYTANYPTQASGLLLDVQNGTWDEEWDITAYGADLLPIAPGPGPNPVHITEASPQANIPGGAVPWQLNLSEPIHRIELSYEGEGSQIGLAFDAFCPTSLPCAEVTNDTVVCDTTGSGDHLYTFDITNLSGVEVHHIILTEEPGVTISPNVLSYPGDLPAPLLPGETLTGVSVAISGVADLGEPETVCFTISMHDSLVNACCSINHCINVDPCCLEVISDSLACTTASEFDYTFSFVNQSSDPVYNVYLLGGTPATFTPNHFTPATPVSPGGTAGPFTTTVTGVAPQDTVCFRVSIHDSLLNECCSIEQCIASPCSAGTTSSGVGDEPVPRAVLYQNHPNPFNPVTLISFELLQAGTVRLDVFDTAGRLVATLAEGPFSAGPHSVEWDGRDDAGSGIASGIYFYRLEAGGETFTRKMLLLK